LIGKRTFGWIACGTVNAKNRMGGYAGAEGFLIFIDQAGTLTAAMQVDWVSTCDTGPMVSVQPEVANAFAPSPAPGSGSVIGVAEELEKLAGLRDKGIISEAEFQTQKAKLLGQ
jgi:hypothetical protein